MDFHFKFCFGCSSLITSKKFIRAYRKCCAAIGYRESEKCRPMKCVFDTLRWLWMRFQCTMQILPFKTEREREKDLKKQFPQNSLLCYVFSVLPSFKKKYPFNCGVWVVRDTFKDVVFRIRNAAATNCILCNRL